MDPEFWSQVSSLWIRRIDPKIRLKQKAFDERIRGMVSLDPNNPLLDDDYEEMDDF